MDPNDTCTHWQSVERCVIDIILRQIDVPVPVSRKRRAVSAPGVPVASSSSSQSIDLSQEISYEDSLPFCNIPFTDLKQLHPDIVSYILNRLVMKKIITRAESEGHLRACNEGTLTLKQEHLRDLEGPSFLRRDFMAKKFSKATISELLNYRGLVRKNAGRYGYSQERGCHSVIIPSASSECTRGKSSRGKHLPLLLRTNAASRLRQPLLNRHHGSVSAFPPVDHSLPPNIKKKHKDFKKDSVNTLYRDHQSVRKDLIASFNKASASYK